MKQPKDFLKMFLTWWEQLNRVRSVGPVGPGSQKGIMKRFFITITLALGASLGGLAVTAGASNASSEVGVMLTTFNQIHAELNSPTATKAALEALFIRFSSEAVIMAGEDHTRSKVINADIRTYAVAANNWAWVGYTTVASNASNLGPWKAANNNLNAVITKFTNDLKAGK